MRAWCFRLVFAVMLPWLAAVPGKAADFDQFYQAYAIVTGTDMRQRPWGMAQCLREVLVKVSGDPRLKDDPRVLELASHADRSVASFDYVYMMAGIPKKDDQGSYDRPHKLTVRFDPAKIDSLLSDLGEKPWHGERPFVVPVLLVNGPKPPAYVLSAETPRGIEQRGTFANAVSEFGSTGNQRIVELRKLFGHHGEIRIQNHQDVARGCAKAIPNGVTFPLARLLHGFDVKRMTPLRRFQYALPRVIRRTAFDEDDFRSGSHPRNSLDGGRDIARLVSGGDDDGDALLR